MHVGYKYNASRHNIAHIHNISLFDLSITARPASIVELKRMQTEVADLRKLLSASTQV